MSSGGNAHVYSFFVFPGFKSAPSDLTIGIKHGMIELITH